MEGHWHGSARPGRRQTQPSLTAQHPPDRQRSINQQFTQLVSSPQPEKTFRIKPYGKLDVRGALIAQ